MKNRFYSWDTDPETLDDQQFVHYMALRCWEDPYDPYVARNPESYETRRLVKMLLNLQGQAWPAPDPKTIQIYVYRPAETDWWFYRISPTQFAVRQDKRAAMISWALENKKPLNDRL